jgi:Tol biopolymer transport system component
MKRWAAAVLTVLWAIAGPAFAASSSDATHDPDLPDWPLTRFFDAVDPIAITAGSSADRIGKHQGDASKIFGRARSSRADKLFGVPGGCNGFIYSMATAPSGLVYLGGTFSACEEVLASNVAAYDPRTRRFLALGSGAANGVSGGSFGGVYALAFIGDDLYVGGAFDAAGGQPASNVARWDGSNWSRLGSPESNGVNGVVLDLATAGADVYVGGVFSAASTVPARSVARWNGSNWFALGAGVGASGDPQVFAVLVAGSEVYVGGAFSQAGGQPANNVARWNGSVWSALGSGTGNGTNGVVNALAAIGSEVYVGGQYSVAGGQSADALARWNGSAWSVVGTPAANGVSGGVLELRAAGADLYVGGFFTVAGDQTANAVARWNGSVWSSLGTGAQNGTNNTVWALTLVAGEVFVGGEFNSAGGEPASFMAGWDGTRWRAPGIGAGNGLNNGVDALAVYGADLYAGGEFTQAAGQPASKVARWNGSNWATLGSGEANGVDSRVFALQVFANDLYVGGRFGNAGGQPANQIARWNGSVWSDVGGGVGGAFPSVLAIEAVGADLYVGGEFTSAGGQTANKVARWNGSSWSALGSGSANGVSAGDFISVNAIKALGNDLFVGGSFTEAGGHAAFAVARWNGSAWSSLGGGAANGVNNIVYALAVSGNDLYVGGGFSEAGAQPISGVARWNGSAWLPLGTLDLNGVNGTVHAIAVSGSDVYVGGSFTRAGGEIANGLARWDGSAWHGLSVDAPPQIVRAMIVDNGTLYAGGAGLTQTPLPDLQSRAVSGAPANGRSERPVVSRNGSRLSFASDASNLVADDGNGRSDIYTRDPLLGSVVRSSAAVESINGGIAESFADPAISADGARVAFSGSSGQVYAVVDGAARVLSRSASGAPGNGPSGKAFLPGTGTLAVFESQASNLLAGADGNAAVADIFVADLASGAVTLVSNGPNGEPANGASTQPWASDDGQTIVYSTLATNIVPGSASPPRGVKNGTILQATMMSSGGRTRLYLSRSLTTGELGNGDSINVRVTPDGRHGVFESLASNLMPGDDNNARDIFRFEVSNGLLTRLERVSTSRYGAQSNGHSRNASISDDGQFVTFETDASNLIEVDRNGTSDILVKWMVTGEVVRLSRTVDGNQPNGASVQPAISGDGSVIVFGSAATNLAPGDGNGVPDVFAVEVRERTSSVVTGPLDEPGLSRFALPAPNPPNANCPSGFFSAIVDDGPGEGLTPGAFGMELLLDDPGTRVLAGGLNFGGLIDVGQVGFAAFNIANSANEPQRLNLSLTGSGPNAGAEGTMMRIRISRRTATTSDSVFESTQLITMDAPYVTSIDLPPAFYEATVAPTSGSPGGAAEGQFYFSLTTSFIGRPGGGFQGGAVVGGYHAAHPFGGVSGFAAFCLATPHTTSVRVLSRPSYGPAGAQDLRLRIRDAEQRDVVVVPAG